MGFVCLHIPMFSQEGAIHNIRELSGVVPPMITPFADDDSIDCRALESEARFLRDTGVQGIVVAGSTGEGAGLSERELHEAVRVVIQSTEGALPVLGGIIADTSEEAVRLGIAAKSAGACGLQVPPPHFQYVTSVEILARYYQDITDATGLPLIIYNVVPWAQVATASLNKICSENPMIIGVKQSGYNIHALAELLANLRGKIKFFSAIDDLIYPSFMLGVDGTISGTSSLFPRETIEILRCVQKGDFRQALDLHNRILPVWRCIEGPGFPGQIKYAMSLLGRSTGKPRSPFSWPPAHMAARIERELRAGGFLPSSGDFLDHHTPPGQP
ncbi:MAG: dihydrodipicolinate synthase family protein, partial [Terriglobia bacterium]